MSTIGRVRLGGIGGIEFDVFTANDFGLISGRGLYGFGRLIEDQVFTDYIGMSTDFLDRHNEAHHRIDAARARGMNVLLIRQEAWASEGELERLEADLIEALQPPLNTQHRRIGAAEIYAPQAMTAGEYYGNALGIGGASREYSLALRHALAQMLP